MNDVVIVEGERKRTLQTLDCIFGVCDLPRLPAIADEVEAVLAMECKTVALRHGKAVCGCEHPEGSSYLVGEQQEFYAITVSPDVLDAGLLQISLMPRSADVPRDISTAAFPIVGSGKYREAHFYFPSHLRVRLDLFASLVRAVYESGYAWVKQKIEGLVAKQEVALVSDLYGYMKCVMPSDPLRKSLWFACITEGYGFRLIERDVAVEAFALIDRHSSAYGCSTNLLVAELLSTRLPSSQLLMQICVNVNRCIDGKLSQAGYAQKGSIYASTLAALYGRDSFTIFPIQTSPRLSVLALFPTDRRTLIEPLLIEHQAELRQIISKNGSRIKKALRLFEGRMRKRIDIKSLNEALLLQPNFMGVGINFNQLLSRLSGVEKTDSAG